MSIFLRWWDCTTLFDTFSRVSLLSCWVSISFWTFFGLCLIQENPFTPDVHKSERNSTKEKSYVFCRYEWTGLILYQQTCISLAPRSLVSVVPKCVVFYCRNSGLCSQCSSFVVELLGVNFVLNVFDQVESLKKRSLTFSVVACEVDGFCTNNLGA